MEGASARELTIEGYQRRSNLALGEQQRERGPQVQVQVQQQEQHLAGERRQGQPRAVEEPRLALVVA